MPNRDTSLLICIMHGGQPCYSLFEPHFKAFYSISLNSLTLKTYKSAPRSCFYIKYNQSYDEISKSAIRWAAILDFLILSGIPWFASVNPVRNGLSILKNPNIQIFMLPSGSEHLGLILLHIYWTISVLLPLYYISPVRSHSHDAINSIRRSASDGDGTKPMTSVIYDVIRLEVVRGSSNVPIEGHF